MEEFKHHERAEASPLATQNPTMQNTASVEQQDKGHEATVSAEFIKESFEKIDSSPYYKTLFVKSVYPEIKEGDLTEKHVEDFLRKYPDIKAAHEYARDTYMKFTENITNEEDRIKESEDITNFLGFLYGSRVEGDVRVTGTVDYVHEQGVNEKNATTEAHYDEIEAPDKRGVDEFLKKIDAAPNHREVEAVMREEHTRILESLEKSGIQISEDVLDSSEYHKMWGQAEHIMAAKKQLANTKGWVYDNYSIRKNIEEASLRQYLEKRTRE